MEKQTEMNTETKFEKPRHWVSMEELTPQYWNDSAIQERRSQEFFDKPIETLEKIESMDKSGVSRRDFLTIMGASMAMASFACARRPVNKIIPYVVQPQELTPGVPLFYASTYKEGSNSYGIVVKTREGRPIKLEGNELDPSSKGALNAQGQASLLSLYDPERLKAPMKGSKAGGKFSTNWGDVDALVVAALKASKKIRILSLPENSESTRRMMKEFMTGADLKWIEVDPIGMYDVIDGQSESYGTSVIPSYSFDQADVVVSFGADFLGSKTEIEASGAGIEGAVFPDLGVTEAFRSRYRQTYGNDIQIAFAANAYDVASLVASAFSQTPAGTLTSAEVLSKLKNMPPLIGAHGSFVFEQSHDHGPAFVSEIIIRKIEGGEIHDLR